jgi:hypothetical protein
LLPPDSCFLRVLGDRVRTWPLRIPLATPSVHRMVVELERKGSIRRQPGRARSTELLVPVESLPLLR